MDLRPYYESAHRRWVAAGYPNYQAWVPVLFHSVTLGAAVAAVLQRVPDGHGWPAFGLVSLALFPYVVAEVVSPGLIRWPYFAAISLGSLGVLTWQYPVGVDFAVFMAAMIVGRFAAIESIRASLLVWAVAFGGLIWLSLAGLVEVPAYNFAILLVSWDIGWLLQTQQRRIDHQVLMQEERAANAVLEERQRIAREVHDVVAHSLSVTLLHLTAARRELEEGGDVSEAVDALRDAELVGRQAMNDIRHTVGLLGQESTTTSLPDLSDVAALVAQFRAAGLDVAYDARGSVDAVSGAASTGLFRIVQESLANIAKHEPRASASVRLDLRSDPARLVVRNELTHPVPPQAGGSGLRGMRERAAHLGASLTASPSADGWEVSVELPRSAGHCPLPKLRRANVEPA